MLKTPILIMAFRRPDCTRQVFESVRKMAPSKLYISLDGPRSNNTDDATKRREVEQVFEKIDWPCEVKKRYNEKNLGSAPHIISAIDWLFENEEAGIILEDDCVPDQTFYGFTEKMLAEYKDNNKVMAVNGSCFVSNNDDTKTANYYYSKYFMSWGWATWRRAWKLFRFDIEGSKELMSRLSKEEAFGLKPRECKYWSKYFDRFEQNIYPFWDGRWMHAIWKNNGLCITPAENLVLNVGFSSDATHTFKRDKNIPDHTTPIGEPIGPKTFSIDTARDQRLFEDFYYKNFWQKAVFKIQLYTFRLFKKTTV